MKPADQNGQSMQRVKVALTGLAAVLVLIGLASLILGSASRDHPAAAVGAPIAGAVGRPSLGNAGDPSEPLAELGVTPSTQSNAAAPEAAAP